MLRYRRYRVYVAIALATCIGLYFTFASGSKWAPSTTIASDTLKGFNLLPSKIVPGSGNVPSPAASRPAKSLKADSSKPIAEEANLAVKPTVVRGIPIEKATPIKLQEPEELPHLKATTTQDSVAAAEETPNRKSKTKSRLWGEPDPRLGKARSSKPNATPSPSTSDVIHWSRQTEHFPVSSIIQLPTGEPTAIPRIQHKFGSESASQKEDRLQKLHAIKQATLFSWNGYKKFAWLHDELKPDSGTFKDPFCGWAATLVDSLDTLWMMDLKEEFAEAVEAVATIDFTTTPRMDIPLFETTIRYLGGMIAAYDLSEQRHHVLVDKSVELAEILMGAFDTPNRMPMTFYTWKPAFASQPHRAKTRVVLAELGSLSLEFTRLAQITKEAKYYDAIARITDAFEEWQDRADNGTQLPGLWPTWVDASGCEKPAQMATTAQQPSRQKQRPLIGDDGRQVAPKIDETSVVSKNGVSGMPRLDVTGENVANGDAAGAVSHSLQNAGQSDRGSNSAGDEFFVNGEPGMRKMAGQKAAQPASAKSDEYYVADEPGMRKKTGQNAAQSASDKSDVYPAAAEPGMLKKTGQKAAQAKSDEAYEDFVAGEPGMRKKTGEKVAQLGSAESDKYPLGGEPGMLKKTGQKAVQSGGTESDEYFVAGEPGVGKIAGWDSPISEGALDSPANKEKLFDGKASDIKPTRKKLQPRQLGGQLAEDAEGNEVPVKTSKAVDYEDVVVSGKPGTTSDDSIHAFDEEAMPRKPSKPAAGEDAMAYTPGGAAQPKTSTPAHPEELDVCLPQGLTSSSKYGGDKFTMGGMADSVYEYLPKEYILLGGMVKQYHKMYKTAIDVATEYLLYRPMTPTNADILFAGEWRSTPGEEGEINGTLHTEGQHLTCFVGGMYALGAKIFDRPGDLKIAAKLTEGCVWAYSVTTTKIMPEIFELLPCESRAECEWDKERYWDALDPHPESRLALPTLKSDSTSASSARIVDPDYLPELVDTPLAAEAKSSLSSPPNSEPAVYNSKAQNVKRAAIDLDRDSSIPSPPQPGPAHHADPVAGYPAHDGPASPYPGADSHSSFPPSSADNPAPKGPLSHAEFAKARIRDERLPGGMTRINAKGYILRPEAIESVFYMYRITGDQHWRDVGWDMWLAVSQATKATYGASAIDDVTSSTIKLRDGMESFWIAETLKYFYLLFADEDLISLDQWVLNTEAHPFRRADA